MKNEKRSDRSILNRKSFRSGCVSFALLCSLIGFLPKHSSAQPLADGKEKFLGAATSATLSRYLERYFNQVTPGNDGKWGSVENVQDQYSWTNLDKIYNFAVNRGFPYKHHTLVWGNQQPGWIAGLDSATQRAEVEEWIQLVGQRYLKMAYVDVVNEPFHAVPSYKNALGGDGATGWDWVVTAFELARQYCDSSVKLLLNEYNVLHSNTVTTNYLALIDTLKVRGLIDGIGIQGHYFEFRSDISSSSGTYIYDIATIKNNLNRLTATGLPVYISEFDIDEPVDSNQVAQYKIYFPIFWDNPGVKGITFWGYIDSDVWTSHPNTYLLYYDGTERPVVEWLRTYINTPQPPQPPVLISPVSTENEPRNPVLIWNSSETATSYHVQVATSGTFSTATTVVDSTVADTLLQTRLLGSNKVIYWRVNASNENGASDYSSMAAFITGETILAVEETEGIPTEFNLAQNYPNPFNPSTTICYDLPQNAYVNITIYDMLGRIIDNLVDGLQSAKSYTVLWNPSRLSSGIYFCRIHARSQDGSDEFTSIKKLLFIK